MEDKSKMLLHEDIPSVLPVIPTMDVVMFPHMVVPLLVVDEQIVRGIEYALETHKNVLLLATKEQDNDFSGPIGIHDLYHTGTVASLMRVMKLPEGGIKVLVQGVVKASVEEILSDEGMLTVSIQRMPFDTSVDNQSEVEARVRNIISLIEAISVTGRTFGPDAQVILSQIKDPEKIADFILSHLNLTVPQGQELLEHRNICDFLDGIHELLSNEIEIGKVQEKIQAHARESINKSQREYYLREQLRAIKKELGDDNDAEVEELFDKLATLPLPDEARTEAEKQVRRLEKIPPDSMETTVIRNYLDWLLALPWGEYTTDNLDILHAKQVLNEDHFGLEEIKDRILDFLSVRAIKDNCHTPILCFAGPPGVGKTSLGHSIARSMNRNFFRISLGGVHDESEIRGHRRTYVGSMPGRFVQAIRKANSFNPLIMIDEIDKIGRDQRGDPSAALLELLDPKQNTAFYDNYLGVHIDLSKVLFIATANDLSTISTPLRDRMEIIELSGYTLDEKIEISKRHLITKAKENFGLEKSPLDISTDVICSLITSYTRESGVRQLERTIHKLCSKFARHLVEENKNVTFTSQNLANYLGVGMPNSSATPLSDKVGVANGLAWSAYGGAMLQVEAVLMPGSGKLLLTGKLGDVIKESAQAAVTYAKAHAQQYNIPQHIFTDFDLHIHLPAGGTPKDGPSAGITLLSAILSAFTMRPINSTFAMTGEITLQGDVLPIGGVKEKILAAKQEGIKHVIFPYLNQQEVEKAQYCADNIEITLVKTVGEVLDLVLMPKQINPTDTAGENAETSL